AEPAEDGEQPGPEVGIVGEPAAVVCAVVRRAKRPERDAAADERRQPRRSLGRVGANPPAVREGDLRRREAVRDRLLEVAGAEEEERRQLLRAADLARRLVAHGPAAVARDAERSAPAAPEPLS